MTTQFPIRRAWVGCVADGRLRDLFANAVARRITEESEESAAQGHPAELVSNFVGRCDAVFEAHGPETAAAVEALAAEIDTADLYDLCGD